MKTYNTKSVSVLAILITALLLCCDIYAASASNNAENNQKKTEPQAATHNKNKEENTNQSTKNLPNKPSSKSNTTSDKDGLEKKTNNQQAAANNSNNLNSALVEYTRYLAYSTILLCIATFVLAFITGQLKRIANNEFRATHRAKIIVHTFEHAADTASNISPIFTYVNTGTSCAQIKSISYKVFFSSSLRPGVAMETHEFDQPKRILPGGNADFLVESDVSEMNATIEDVRRRRGQSNVDLLCIGRISYSDHSGANRETGFCRKLDGSNYHWLKVENSDYEYSY